MKGLRSFVDWPLRAKLGALIITASLLPLSVASFIGIRHVRDRMLAQTGALLAARADQLAGGLDALLDSFRGSAERIAHLPEAMRATTGAHAEAAGSIDDLPSVASLRHLLDVLPAHDPRVIAVALVDPKGIIRAASD